MTDDPDLPYLQYSIDEVRLLKKKELIEVARALKLNVEGWDKSTLKRGAYFSIMPFIYYFRSMLYRRCE